MRGAKRLLALPLVLVAALAGGAAQSVCGPFTDVPPALCPFVAELYFTGITAGTSPTTFSPESPITRGQAAVFVAKGLDQPLRRGSRRAALGQWWTTSPLYSLGLGVTPVGIDPSHCVSDGSDIWVTNNALDTTGGTVSRVRASDGRVLETWTGATSAFGIVLAAGRVFVTGVASLSLYSLDPSLPAGPVATVTSTLTPFPGAIAFDGANLWIAIGSGSVSIISPSSGAITGFGGFSAPAGLVFDGVHMWIADHAAGTLIGMSPEGVPYRTVAVGASPLSPIFDGANLWVPNSGDDSVTVVRASSGEVIATLTGNGLSQPFSAAFDGERVMVTNPSADSVSLWKAADLTPLGAKSTGSGTRPVGVCSDGKDFWVTLRNTGELARF